MVGLITNGDESGYRREVDDLVRWSENHNLILNISKTKEMVVDFRRKANISLPPLSPGKVAFESKVIVTRNFSSQTISMRSPEQHTKSPEKSQLRKYVLLHESKMAAIGAIIREMAKLGINS